MEKYNFIETGDGSVTLYSDEYRESMHSDSGAYEEAVMKHVNPSGVLDGDDDQVHVLDIGFGLGYNILALIHEASKRCPGKKINVVSLEKDASYAALLDSVFFNDERDLRYSLIKEAFRKGRADDGTISVSVLPGDARRTLLAIKGIAFNAIFHDPYSPAKNPELWTLDFFMEMRGLLGRNAVLTTYSSAPQIRMALLDAGYFVGAGPAVGRKREGTIASNDEGIKTLTGHELHLLRENIKSTPYRDPGLCDSREMILERRIREMKEKRIKAGHQVHEG
jgi:tRNA U34 5-methylaminomethyl-2-thiouridine-forming methyltransferase MnmC